MPQQQNNDEEEIFPIVLNPDETDPSIIQNLISRSPNKQLLRNIFDQLKQLNLQNQRIETKIEYFHYITLAVLIISTMGLFSFSKK